MCHLSHLHRGSASLTITQPSIPVVPADECVDTSQPSKFKGKSRLDVRVCSWYTICGFQQMFGEVGPSLQDLQNTSKSFLCLFYYIKENSTFYEPKAATLLSQAKRILGNSPHPTKWGILSAESRVLPNKGFYGLCHRVYRITSLKGNGQLDLHFLDQFEVQKLWLTSLLWAVSSNSSLPLTVPLLESCSEYMCLYDNVCICICIVSIFHTREKNIGEEGKKRKMIEVLHHI